MLAAANALGLAAFLWPFALPSTAGSAVRWLPMVWMVVLPLVMLTAAQTLLGLRRDIRQVTLSATLIAFAVAVRPLGAGVAGLEPMWAVLLLAGRALGAQTGFVVGALSMLVSGMVTGGVGPWLPYQMMVGAWAGAAPALVLPRLRGRSELLLLTCLGFATGLLAGALLNLWFWPQAIGLDPAIALQPGAPVLDNLARWARNAAITSFGFDVPRAVLTASLLAVTGGTLLPMLRRATRRASLIAEVQQEPAPSGTMPT